MAVAVPNVEPRARDHRPRQSASAASIRCHQHNHKLRQYKSHKQRVGQIYEFLLTFKQEGGGKQAKHSFEDEAQESEEDFIDDEEPDESNSDAAAMTREVITAMRNRGEWKRSQRVSCKLCNDLKHVLKYLLDLED
jgi:hypothetical protein